MPSPQYNILVVDDDRDDREILRDAFAAIGAEGHLTLYPSAAAFLAALPELRMQEPLTHLVVLDYSLPGTNGAAILAQLKNDRVLKSIAVVMYSSSMSRTQQVDCQEKGAEWCFEKGTTFGEVVVFARELCRLAFREQLSA